MLVLRQFLLRPHLYLMILLAGISSKFYHLDHKLLWIDEVYTIQHTSGIPDREYPALIPVNEILDAEFYRDLYRLAKQDRPLLTELRGLAGLPTLNPLHYPLLMMWYRVVGDDPVHFRAFSVFVFLMTLPMLFLLAVQLFDSRLGGWIAVSLYAVSPYIHLFAQEARYYILWSLVLTVLHYCLLRAMHGDTLRWWSAYAVSVTLSLYCSPVSIIVVAGHCAYVLLIRRHLWVRIGVSSLAGLMAYLPWALLLFLRRDTVMAGLAWQTGNQHGVAAWLPLFGQGLFLISVFSFRIDYLSVFSHPSPDIGPEAGAAAIFNVLVLVMLAVSLGILLMKSKREVRWFLILIVLPGLVSFYVVDLIRHSMISWWWRYLIFAAPGVILLMANTFRERLAQGSLLFGAAYVVVAVIGIASIGSIAEAKHWHIGDRMDSYIANARVIEHARRPLLVSDCATNGSMVDLMVVLHECAAKRVDVLRVAPDVGRIESRIGEGTYSDIYVISSSEALIRNLNSQYHGSVQVGGAGGQATMWKLSIGR